MELRDLALIECAFVSTNQVYQDGLELAYHETPSTYRGFASKGYSLMFSLKTFLISLNNLTIDVHVPPIFTIRRVSSVPKCMCITGITQFWLSY